MFKVRPEMRGRLPQKVTLETIVAISLASLLISACESPSPQPGTAETTATPVAALTKTQELSSFGQMLEAGNSFFVNNTFQIPRQEPQFLATIKASPEALAQAETDFYVAMTTPEMKSDQLKTTEAILAKAALDWSLGEKELSLFAAASAQMNLAEFPDKNNAKWQELNAKFQAFAVFSDKDQAFKAALGKKATKAQNEFLSKIFITPEQLYQTYIRERFEKEGKPGEKQAQYEDRMINAWINKQVLGGKYQPEEEGKSFQEAYLMWQKIVPDSWEEGMLNRFGVGKAGEEKFREWMKSYAFDLTNVSDEELRWYLADQVYYTLDALSRVGAYDSSKALQTMPADKLVDAIYNNMTPEQQMDLAKKMGIQNVGGFFSNWQAEFKTKLDDLKTTLKDNPELLKRLSLYALSHVIAEKLFTYYGPNSIGRVPRIDKVKIEEKGQDASYRTWVELDNPITLSYIIPPEQPTEQDIFLTRLNNLTLNLQHLDQSPLNPNRKVGETQRVTVTVSYPATRAGQKPQQVSYSFNFDNWGGKQQFLGVSLAMEMSSIGPFMLNTELGRTNKFVLQNLGDNLAKSVPFIPVVYALDKDDPINKHKIIYSCETSGLGGSVPCLFSSQMHKGAQVREGNLVFEGTIPVNVPPGEIFNSLLTSPTDDLTAYFRRLLPPPDPTQNMFARQWNEKTGSSPNSKINAYVYPFSYKDVPLFWNPTRRLPPTGKSGDVYWLLRTGWGRWINYNLLDKMQTSYPMPVTTDPEKFLFDLNDGVVKPQTKEGTEAFVIQRNPLVPESFWAVNKNKYIVSPRLTTENEMFDLWNAALELVLISYPGHLPTKLLEILAFVNLPPNLVTELPVEAMLVGKTSLPETIK